MVYGNTRTKLVGIIREIQKRSAVIEFPKYQKELIVPRLLIHSKLSDKIDTKQELEIETWYLKRNHILPLLD